MQKNPHLVIGFDPWIVQPNHFQSKYPLVLPGAEFLHVFYLHLFTHYLPKAVTAAANQYNDCEDMVMSVLVSGYLAEQGVPQCPNMLLAAKMGISVSHKINGKPSLSLLSMHTCTTYLINAKSKVHG